MPEQTVLSDIDRDIFLAMLEYDSEPNAALVAINDQSMRNQVQNRKILNISPPFVNEP